MKKPELSHSAFLRSRGYNYFIATTTVLGALGRATAAIFASFSCLDSASPMPPRSGGCAFRLQPAKEIDDGWQLPDHRAE
jgi:hypothetical protein